MILILVYFFCNTFYEHNFCLNDDDDNNDVDEMLLKRCSLCLPHHFLTFFLTEKIDFSLHFWVEVEKKS